VLGWGRLDQCGWESQPYSIPEGRFTWRLWMELIISSLAWSSVTVVDSSLEPCLFSVFASL